MAQPNYQKPDDGGNAAQIQAQILQLQYEELLAARAKRQKEEAAVESEEAMKARFRETISGEWRRAKAKTEQEQATCSHRLSNGRPAIVGQKDMQGQHIFLCQICQGMKQGIKAFMDDPKWAQLGPSINMEFIGGPTF